MRNTIVNLIARREWELAVILIIILNAITLGLETSDAVMARWGGILHVIDRVVLGLFVVEIALRIYAHRLKFFTDPWGVFDFTIVAISLLPAAGALSILRAFRILRVLRLVSMVPSLRRVIGGLIGALPGMGSVVILLSLIFYVFAVMATNLYGEDFPDWFGTIPASLYSLFQIMTLESWSMGIVRPVMEAHPHAWAFFVPFIISTAFTVLNLFIGVIVAAMQKETDALAEADRQALHSETEVVLTEVRALREEVSALKDALRESRQ